MREKLERTWQQLTIKRKIATFTGVVFLIILLSVVFDSWIVKFCLVDFNKILVDNGRCSELVQAIKEESESFEAYIKTSDEAEKKLLEENMEHTRKAVNALPFAYREVGEIRYAKTWTVRNCYEVYCQKRDAVLVMQESNLTYISSLYEVYEIQEYLQNYAGALMECTIEDGNRNYEHQVRKLIHIPLSIIISGIVLLLVMVQLARAMNKTIVYPVQQLGEASKRIAANDFFVEDVVVDNRDEIGELVHAFNKMKYATGEYILALEEKRKTLDLLHEEELSKLEAQKRLESMNLELLKSQINPHFLFNTLNVIGGMANLEDAATTEKMIKALSALFRYNLKTPEEEVPLAKELKVVSDYMYLQEMRFGNRISYAVDCQVESEFTMVPSFTFQPLVENAIIHGLSPKEEGGIIKIRIRKRGGVLSAVIGDNGIGMTKEELLALRQQLVQGDEACVGIGLGNIYKRISVNYPGSSFKIYSRENVGTVIRIGLPQA